MVEFNREENFFIIEKKKRNINREGIEIEICILIGYIY